MTVLNANDFSIVLAVPHMDKFKNKADFLAAVKLFINGMEFRDFREFEIHVADNCDPEWSINRPLINMVSTEPSSTNARRAVHVV